MKIINNAERDVVQNQIASRITAELAQDKSVLLLLSGGSSALIGALVIEALRESPNLNQKQLKDKLTVSLVDERFGPEGHGESNWRLLLENSFDPLSVRSVPLLEGQGDSTEDFEKTSARFSRLIAHAVKSHKEGNLFITAIFGIGQDGHTAGILPESPAALLSHDGNEWVWSYESARYRRITIAPAFFSHIDFAAAWVDNPDKRKAIEDVQLSLSSVQEPAQLLKRCSETIVFLGPHF